MSEQSHPHAEANFIKVNTVDPTESKTVRNEFQQSMTARWRSVRGRNRNWISSLNTPLQPADVLQRYRGNFYSIAMSEVVEQSTDEQVDRGDHWTASFVRQAYQKGLELARRDLNSLTSVSDEATKQATQFNDKAHQQELKNQYTRAYAKLESQVTAARDEVFDTFDALVSEGRSRTHIIEETNAKISGSIENNARAHANVVVVRTVNMALLTAFEKAGIEQIAFSTEQHVDAENRGNYSVKVNAAGEVRWQTAGDDNVCPQCQALEGKTLKISEVKGNPQFQPPIHPNCRCRLVPTDMETAGVDIPADDSVGLRSDSAALGPLITDGGYMKDPTRTWPNGLAGAAIAFPEEWFVVPAARRTMNYLGYDPAGFAHESWERHFSTDGAKESVTYDSLPGRVFDTAMKYSALYLFSDDSRAQIYRIGEEYGDTGVRGATSVGYNVTRSLFSPSTSAHWIAAGGHFVAKEVIEGTRLSEIGDPGDEGALDTAQTVALDAYARAAAVQELVGNDGITKENTYLKDGLVRFTDFSKAGGDVAEDVRDVLVDIGERLTQKDRGTVRAAIKANYSLVANEFLQRTGLRQKLREIDEDLAESVENNGEIMSDGGFVLDDAAPIVTQFLDMDGPLDEESDAFVRAFSNPNVDSRVLFEATVQKWDHTGDVVNRPEDWRRYLRDLTETATYSGAFEVEVANGVSQDILRPTHDVLDALPDRDHITYDSVNDSLWSWQEAPHSALNLWAWAMRYAEVEGDGNVKLPDEIDEADLPESGEFNYGELTGAIRGGQPMLRAAFGETIPVYRAMTFDPDTDFGDNAMRAIENDEPFKYTPHALESYTTNPAAAAQFIGDTDEHAMLVKTFVSPDEIYATSHNNENLLAHEAEVLVANQTTRTLQPDEIDLYRPGTAPTSELIDELVTTHVQMGSPGLDIPDWVSQVRASDVSMPTSLSQAILPGESRIILNQLRDETTTDVDLASGLANLWGTTTANAAPMLGRIERLFMDDDPESWSFSEYSTTQGESYDQTFFNPDDELASFMAAYPGYPNEDFGETMAAISNEDWSSDAAESLWVAATRQPGISSDDLPDGVPDEDLGDDVDFSSSGWWNREFMRGDTPELLRDWFPSGKAPVFQSMVIDPNSELADRIRDAKANGEDLELDAEVVEMGMMSPSSAVAAADVTDQMGVVLEEAHDLNDIPLTAHTVAEFDNDSIQALIDRTEDGGTKTIAADSLYVADAGEEFGDTAIGTVRTLDQYHKAIFPGVPDEFEGAFNDTPSVAEYLGSAMQFNRSRDPFGDDGKASYFVNMDIVDNDVFVRQYPDMPNFLERYDEAVNDDQRLVDLYQEAYNDLGPLMPGGPAGDGMIAEDSLRDLADDLRGKRADRQFLVTALDRFDTGAEIPHWFSEDGNVEMYEDVPTKQVRSDGVIEWLDDDVDNDDLRERLGDQIATMWMMGTKPPSSSQMHVGKQGNLYVPNAYRIFGDDRLNEDVPTANDWDSALKLLDEVAVSGSLGDSGAEYDEDTAEELRERFVSRAPELADEYLNDTQTLNSLHQVDEPRSFEFVASMLRFSESDWEMDDLPEWVTEEGLQTHLSAFIITEDGEIMARSQYLAERADAALPVFWDAPEDTDVEQAALIEAMEKDPEAVPAKELIGLVQEKWDIDGDEANEQIRNRLLAAGFFDVESEVLNNEAFSVLHGEGEDKYPDYAVTSVLGGIPDNTTMQDGVDAWGKGSKNPRTAGLHDSAWAYFQQEFDQNGLTPPPRVMSALGVDDVEPDSLRTDVTYDPMETTLDEEVEAIDEMVGIHTRVFNEVFEDGEVPALRGMVAQGEFGEYVSSVSESDDTLEINHRPIESWSLDPNVSRRFALGNFGTVSTTASETTPGLLLFDKVPADRIVFSQILNEELQNPFDESEIVAGQGRNEYSPERYITFTGADDIRDEHSGVFVDWFRVVRSSLAKPVIDSATQILDDEDESTLEELHEKYEDTSGLDEEAQDILTGKSRVPDDVADITQLSERAIMAAGTPNSGAPDPPTTSVDDETRDDLRELISVDEAGDAFERSDLIPTETDEVAAVMARLLDTDESRVELGSDDTHPVAEPFHQWGVNGYGGVASLWHAAARRMGLSVDEARMGRMVREADVDQQQVNDLTSYLRKQQELVREELDGPVTLYRGYSAAALAEGGEVLAIGDPDDPEKPDSDIVRVTPNIIESWTTKRAVAESYASGLGDNGLVAERDVLPKEIGYVSGFSDAELVAQGEMTLLRDKDYVVAMDGAAEALDVSESDTPDDPLRALKPDSELADDLVETGVASEQSAKVSDFVDAASDDPTAPETLELYQQFMEELDPEDRTYLEAIQTSDETIAETIARAHTVFAADDADDTFNPERRAEESSMVDYTSPDPNRPVLDTDGEDFGIRTTVLDSLDDVSEGDAMRVVTDSGHVVEGKVTWRDDNLGINFARSGGIMTIPEENISGAEQVEVDIDGLDTQLANSVIEYDRDMREDVARGLQKMPTSQVEEIVTNPASTKEFNLSDSVMGQFFLGDGRLFLRDRMWQENTDEEWDDLDEKVSDLHEDGWVAQQNVEDIIAHELVHAEHFAGVDQERLSEIHNTELRNALTDDELQLVEEQVSEYALENPKETVAEIGVIKSRGEFNELPADDRETLQDIYERFDGPDIGVAQKGPKPTSSVLNEDFEELVDELEDAESRGSGALGPVMDPVGPSHARDGMNTAWEETHEETLQQVAEDNDLSVEGLLSQSQETMRNAFSNSEVRVRVPNNPDILESLLEKGHIVNQHESDRSQGMYNPEVRKNMEQFLFSSGADVGYKDDQPSDFPVYGYLADGDVSARDEWFDDDHYGTLAFKMNPEVRERSTLTMYDSNSGWSNNPNEQRIVPSPINDPDPQSFKNPEHLAIALEEAESVGDLAKRLQNQPDARHGLAIIEAQIHGDNFPSLEEDVREIEVVEDASDALRDTLNEIGERYDIDIVFAGET